MRLLGVVIMLLSANVFGGEKPVFVVNKQNPIGALSADEVRDYFLKRRSQWPDGTPVRFIDWQAGHPLRTSFLDQIIKKSPRELEVFWVREMQYRGNSAPIKVATPDMVIAFVSRLAGAIGYIPERATIRSTRVKRVEIFPEEQ